MLIDKRKNWNLLNIQHIQIIVLKKNVQCTLARILIKSRLHGITGISRIQYILIHGITCHSMGSLQTENKYSLNVAFTSVLRDTNWKKSRSIFRHPSGIIKWYMRRPTTRGNSKCSVSLTWILNKKFKSPFWRMWSLFKLFVFLSLRNWHFWGDSKNK